MGANMSVTRSGDRITRDRIREVCQVDPSVPEELRNFRVELLANDLSSIGFLVPVMDKSGKSLSTNAICSRISEAIPPPVENMCMVGSKGSNKGIYKLVDMYNINYGANIPLKNSLGKSRPVEDICDDLYLVSDRVQRQLGGDTVRVKKALETHIEGLVAQRAMLEATFAKNIGALNEGHRYDDADAKIKELTGHQKTLINELDTQLRDLNNQYELAQKDMDEKVKVSQASLVKDLNDYATLSALSAFPILGSDKTFDKVGTMLRIAQSSGVHTGQCTNCINKVFGSVAEYTNAQNTGKFKERLNEYVALSNRHNKTPAEIQEMINCVKTLSTMTCVTGQSGGMSHNEAYSLMNSMP
jgi:hypothetical protein